MKFSLFSATLLAAGIASAAAPVNGWYAAGFGGYAYLPENINTTRFGVLFSNPSYNNGFNAGGRLGYQNYPMRYELEYTYIQADTRSFELDHITQTGISGNSNANLGMANIYYDFPDNIIPSINPFLGVGIGYAYIQNSLGSTGPGGITFFKDNTNAFAYQATGGLTYNFAENFALNAAYRYVATATKGEFGQIFQAHLANAAFIYRFDECDYK